MSLLWKLLPYAIVFCFLVQLIPVRINLFFQRKNKNDFLAIRVNTFFSLLRFNVEIPLLHQKSPLDLATEAEVKAGDDKLIKETKQEFSLANIKWKKLRALLKYVRENRKLISFIIRFNLRAVTLEKFTLNIQGGTGDAAVTGVCSGLYWTAAGTISVLAQRLLKVRNGLSFSLCPDYSSKPEFSCLLDTTVSFRLGHFTLAGLIFLINQNPRELIELWKNILYRG